MKKWIVMALLGLLLSADCAAGSVSAMRKTIEASMQVTGEVRIEADGTLKSYSLDREGALPEDVKLLLARYLPACIFSVETASGKPEPVTAKMVLELVARQLPEGGAAISVKGSQFEDPDTPDYIKSVQLAPPNYPTSAARSGMAGTVYVVLRLNPDGSVAQAHVEQVNMAVLGTENALEAGRIALSEAALAAARKWRFEIKPERFAEAGPVDVRVPADFKLFDSPARDRYGKWNAYVPGPYAAIPWRPEARNGQGLGAMIAGGVYPVDAKIKLRSATDGG